jgi:type VI protein secretion system component Hcp
VLFRNDFKGESMAGDNFIWDPDGIAFKGETTDAFFSTLFACEFTTFSFNLGKSGDDGSGAQQSGGGGGGSAGGAGAKPPVNRGLPPGVKLSSLQAAGRSSGGGGGGGGGSVGGAQGKASLGSLTVTKFLDSASTNFYEYCSTGDVIPTLNIAVRKSGGDRLIYLQYCFRANQVTSVSWTGGEGEQRPVETVVIDFKAMAMAYERQSAGASIETDYEGEDPGAHHEWTWNVTQTGAEQTTLIINGQNVDEPFLDPHADFIAE